jgi:hypothetical protein
MLDMHLSAVSLIRIAVIYMETVMVAKLAGTGTTPSGYLQCSVLCDKSII